jgi:hypothetical protein
VLVLRSHLDHGVLVPALDQELLVRQQLELVEHDDDEALAGRTRSQRRPIPRASPQPTSCA